MTRKSTATLILMMFFAAFLGSRPLKPTPQLPTINRTPERLVPIFKVEQAQVMVEQKAQEQKHQKDTYQWKRRLVVTQATGMPLSISDTIINQADLYGLSVPFIIGVIAKETGNKFDPYLVHYNTNGTYDTGLMQINSRTRDWLAEAAGMPNADLFNPYDNVKLGVWYLHFLFVQCKGNEDCTLARYNGDSQNVYAPAVQRLVSRFGDRFRELWQQGE